jgi:hypothetical protein
MPIEGPTALTEYRQTAAHDQPTAAEDAHTIMINRVAWGAIFAGVVVALVVQVVLTMLGAGLGIATLDPGTPDNPAASTFSITAAIWFVVAGIIAAFAGGYIAARMSGRTVPTTGALHGLTTWAVTTLIVLYLLSTAVGSLVGGAFSGVAQPGRWRRTDGRAGGRADARRSQPARGDREPGARHRHRPGSPQHRRRQRAPPAGGDRRRQQR